MAEEVTMAEAGRAKRKFVKNQGRKKSSKKAKVMPPPPHAQKKVRIDKKMKKLFRKRARDYNSDDDEEEAIVHATSESRSVAPITNKRNEEDAIEMRSITNKNSTDMDNHSSDDDDEIQPGITKFTEGCRVFKMAFRNIMKKSVPADMLGPILSGHRKLVVDKLAAEEAEHKTKGEAKKEKHMLEEKGHAKPATWTPMKNF